MENWPINWKKKRNAKKVKSCLEKLSEKAKSGDNIMEVSIECAHAGVTTGEWGRVMREVFGEYRAPTGIVASSINIKEDKGIQIKKIQDRVNQITKKIGRRPKILVGKPGLDGHSNGAEQIAVRARDIGLEVVYDGIRSTPEQLVNTCVDEGIHIIGLSILSGSHIFLVKQTILLMKKIKINNIPIIVGGIIPPSDEKKLIKMGVKQVFTPKNFQIEDIMSNIVDIIDSSYA